MRPSAVTPRARPTGLRTPPQPASAAPYFLPPPRRPQGHAARRSDVQYAQRVALTGIVDRQSGQAFVVGTGSGAGGWRLSRFTPRTSRKTTKATIRKLMSVFTNAP